MQAGDNDEAMQEIETSSQALAKMPEDQ